MVMMAEVPKPQKSERFIMSCSSDEKAAWEAEAARQEVSVAALIRHAMKEYLARVNPPKKSRKPR